VLRDDEAAVGLGIDGTSEWVQDQQMKTEGPTVPSSPSTHAQAKSHKRTHDVEFADEEEETGAFTSHHDDKVRILTTEEAIEVDPENWVADLVDDEDAIHSELLLQQIKRDFKEEQDFWDISMVAEYSDEIFSYMSKLEVSLNVSLVSRTCADLSCSIAQRRLRCQTLDTWITKAKLNGTFFFVS